jgi:hypothetical protein
MARISCRNGTPLRTEGGSKPIEDFKSYEEFGDECDNVLCRNEFDPAGLVTARRVLRKFVSISYPSGQPCCCVVGSLRGLGLKTSARSFGGLVICGASPHDVDGMAALSQVRQ